MKIGIHTYILTFAADATFLRYALRTSGFEVNQIIVENVLFTHVSLD